MVRLSAQRIKALYKCSRERGKRDALKVRNRLGNREHDRVSVVSVFDCASLFSSQKSFLLNSIYTWRARQFHIPFIHFYWRS